MIKNKRKKEDYEPIIIRPKLGEKKYPPEWFIKKTEIKPTPSTVKNYHRTKNESFGNTKFQFSLKDEIEFEELLEKPIISTQQKSTSEAEELTNVNTNTEELVYPESKSRSELIKEYRARRRKEQEEKKRKEQEEKEENFYKYTKTYEEKIDFDYEAILRNFDQYTNLNPSLLRLYKRKIKK